MKKSLLIGLLCSVFCAFGFAEDLQEGFYDKINGLQDGELKDSLKSLIRDHTVISYGSGANSSWGVFYYSDQDEEGYCMDMYCDEWYKFTTPGNPVTGCNIEHSFAKSWWGGGSNDAYKDCYHLNPSNSEANSARSNYPLGIPEKDIKQAGSLRVGKKHHPTMDVDHYVFEPKDEYKGDFARMYMGTLLRWNKDYEPFTTGDGKKIFSGKYTAAGLWGLTEYGIALLLKWHREDPVSRKEIDRNNAVQAAQGNRNPFIDYPYLAEYMWGERAGEQVKLDHMLPSTDPEFIPGQSNGWKGGDPQALEMVQTTPRATKILKDGQIYIVVDEQVYTITGQRIK